MLDPFEGQRNQLCHDGFGTLELLSFEGEHRFGFVEWRQALSTGIESGIVESKQDSNLISTAAVKVKVKLIALYFTNSLAIVLGSAAMLLIFYRQKFFYRHNNIWTSKTLPTTTSETNSDISTTGLCQTPSPLIITSPTLQARPVSSRKSRFPVQTSGNRKWFRWSRFR